MHPTHACTRARTHAHTHTHTHPRIHIHTHTHTHTHIHTHTSRFLHSDVLMTCTILLTRSRERASHTCLHTRTHARTHTHTFTHTQHTYTHTHARTHTHTRSKVSAFGRFHDLSYTFTVPGGVIRGSLKSAFPILPVLPIRLLRRPKRMNLWLKKTSDCFC